jgi:hypothetical protein
MGDEEEEDDPMGEDDAAPSSGSDGEGLGSGRRKRRRGSDGVREDRRFGAWARWAGRRGWWWGRRVLLQIGCSWEWAAAWRGGAAARFCVCDAARLVREQQHFTRPADWPYAVISQPCGLTQASTTVAATTRQMLLSLLLRLSALQAAAAAAAVLARCCPAGARPLLAVMSQAAPLLHQTERSTSPRRARLARHRRAAAARAAAARAAVGRGGRPRQWQGRGSPAWRWWRACAAQPTTMETS